MTVPVMSACGTRCRPGTSDPGLTARPNLRALGQVGTTIGLGLLFDRSWCAHVMTSSIAALLGRWFWWPQRVRTVGHRHRRPSDNACSRRSDETEHIE
jgi:hypothetical protein